MQRLGVGRTARRVIGHSLCCAAHWPWYSVEKQAFLPKTTMTLPLRMLNYFGNGQHYYAWIHEKDVIAMFCHALMTPSVRGVYNAVAPNPIPQKKMLMEEAVYPRHYSCSLCQPLPMRIVLGEMARVVVFSQRVSARKILDTGFTFSFDTVDEAFSDLYSA